MYSVSLFFFFSSRRRHTRSDRDWSSDVCSSDLLLIQEGNQAKLPSRAGAHRAVHVLNQEGNQAKLPSRDHNGDVKPILNQGGRSAKGSQWDRRPPPTPS